MAATVHCPSCGGIPTPGKSFCGNCGTGTAWEFCAACGVIRRSRAGLCVNCGWNHEAYQAGRNPHRIGAALFVALLLAAGIALWGLIVVTISLAGG